MTQDNSLIQLDQVSLVLDRKRILDQVSLDVTRGRIVTIVGPNGAGKSTLLRVLLGLYQPTSGKLQHAPGLKIGYMPQKLTIDRTLPLTVHRFLSLAGYFTRRARRDALAEAGVAHTLFRSIHDLSGGELQRVLLARALLRKPDLLALDEPVQNVDVIGQQAIYSLIEQVRDERNCAVVMVSHDLHLVMAATDHVLCLNHHVCCSGHPDTVTTHPAYLELFGPAAGSGLAVYTHRHDHHHDVTDAGTGTDGGRDHD